VKIGNYDHAPSFSVQILMPLINIASNRYERWFIVVIIIYMIEL